MGPKKSGKDVKAKKEVEVEEEAPVETSAQFSYSIKIIVDPKKKLPNDLKFRVISEWVKPATTTAFGLHSEKWKHPRGHTASPVPTEENEDGEASTTSDIKTTHVATYLEPLHPKVSTEDEINMFNNHPGLFAVMTKTESHNAIPIGFAYIDCSRFLIEHGDICVRGKSSVSDVEFYFSVHSKKELISEEDIMHYEPLILTMDSIGNVPVVDSEVNVKEDELIESTYIYSNLHLGGGINRMIYAPRYVAPSRTAGQSRPGTRGSAMGADLSASAANIPVTLNNNPEEASVAIESQNENESLSNTVNDMFGTTFTNTMRSTYAGYDTNINPFPVENVIIPEILLHYKTVILQGVGDVSKTRLCKESLTSSTFQIELHNDESDYALVNRMFSSKHVEELIASQGKSRPSSRGGHKKPSSAGSVPTNPLSHLAHDDNLLVHFITDSLDQSGKTLYHGCARYRLEQLLSSSNDILQEFSRKRLLLEGEQNKNKFIKENSVVVKEDLTIEIKLTNPSKPLKWSRPKDISLLNTLSKAKSQYDSITMELDPSITKEDVSLALKKSFSKRKIIKPRHERYADCETHIVMHAEVWREFELPKEVPSVLLDSEQMADMGILDATQSKAKPTGALRKSIKNSVNGSNKQTDGVEAGHNSRHSSSADGMTDATASAAEATTKAEEETNYVPIEKSKQKKTKTNGNKTMKEMVLERLSTTPYTRMVIVFKYKDDNMLKLINDAIVRVNSRALPHMQSSIRSYTFSEREIQEVKHGVMDVVCGFSIIDDDTRIVVLEGLAGPGQGMQSIYLDIPRLSTNDKDIKILVNPEVLFPDRMYPEFGPDIKRIRVRDKMKKLSRKPEIYNRKQVEEVCFEAVECVMSLRRATDLLSTKELSMYPSAASLSKLELLYGEAISRGDLDGIAVSEQFALMKRKAAAVRAALEKSGLESHSEEAVDKTNMIDEIPAAITHMRSTENARLLPTDSRNPEYEAYLATKDDPSRQRDYLAEQRAIKREAWEAGLRRAAEKEMLYTKTLTNVLGPGATLKESKIYCYSQQTLNFKVKAVSEMRHKLAKLKDATFTYSQDFVSQTVALTDELENKKANELASKKQWTTPGGFVYPKPRTSAEILLHPKRPTDSRIEELHQKYPEKDPAYVAMLAKNSNPKLLALEQNYSTQTSKTGDLFGTLEAPEYERPFQLKLIGDRHKLPRGHIIKGREKDPEFFKSVHIAGDELTKLIEEEHKKEIEEWNKKVVVDHLDFKVDGYSMKDKPHTQLSRLSDILHDEPKRVVLKHIRSLKSPALGKDWSYSTTPMSVVNTGPFEDPVGNAMQRVEDKTKFITTKAILSNNHQNLSIGEDFTRYIGPKSTIGPNTVYDKVSRKSHQPIDQGKEVKEPALWQYSKPSNI